MKEVPNSFSILLKKIHVNFVKNSNSLAGSGVKTVIGIPFIHLSEVNSTNIYAMEQLQAKLAEHGAVFFADLQTAGKGQMGKNWESEAAFQGLHVNVPAIYFVGERDTGLAMPRMKAIINAMPSLVSQLQISQVIPKVGHWLQQEAPEVVNALLLGFLDSL